MLLNINHIVDKGLFTRENFTYSYRLLSKYIVVNISYTVKIFV